jgi:hypothetical protein
MPHTVSTAAQTTWGPWFGTQYDVTSLIVLPGAPR